MKKLPIYILVISIAILFASCGGSSSSNEMGELITFETLNEHLKNKEMDGKRVSLEAYCKPPTSLRQDVIGGKKNDITIKPELDSKQFLHIPITLKKDSKNAMYAPSTYTKEDIIYYDNEGKSYPFDSKLKFSFTLKRNKQAKPEKNPTTGEYVWDYEDVRIDPIN